MTMATNPLATQIILHKKSRTLEIVFVSGERFILPCAYLRQFSESAEMRHGSPGVINHKTINILAIEPVGNYAIKPIFSDGHRTGIYSWSRLYELGKNMAHNWPSTQ